MYQLNKIGHDFSRVQVGKGRFTYKCRLCFLRGERAFLKQLLHKNVLPFRAALSLCLFPTQFPLLMNLSPFFIGDTPSSEDDPLGWGGDFDQDHQVMSDQDLPLSPVRPMESAEMDPCLSSGHTMEDAEFAECVSGTPDALCSAAEQAKKNQGYVVADDVAAADSRDSFGTADYTHKDTAGAIVDPGTVNFIQSLALNGRDGGADGSDPYFCAYGSRTDAWHSHCAPKIKVSSAARRLNGNLLASLQFIFRSSSVSVTRPFGAGNVAGGRRAAGVHRD